MLQITYNKRLQSLQVTRYASAVTADARRHVYPNTAKSCH